MRTESIKNLSELAARVQSWNPEHFSQYDAETEQRNIIETIKKVIVCEMMRPVTKCKFDIYKYTANDKLRPIMGGVFHDNGYKVASDSHVLCVIKAEYPESLEGKILSKDGEVIDEGRYPNYKSIKPDTTKNDYQKVTLTQDDLNGIKNAVKQWKLEKKADTIDGELVVINGVYFNAKHFTEMLIPFMETFNSYEFYVSNEMRAAITECEYGWCLIMPARPPKYFSDETDTYGHKIERVIPNAEILKENFPTTRAFFINK